MNTDVIIVGGSFAGLSAALQLGRARRDVLVIDAGQNRNRFAHAAHGLLGHDGKSPSDLLAAARNDLLMYPTVQILGATVTSARKHEGGFTVTTDDGEDRLASRLILAGGVTDSLPDVPGLRDFWGKTVFHCPYCHGFEVADRRLGVISTDEFAMHQAQLLREWSDDVTVFMNGSELDAEPGFGIRVEQRSIESVIGTGDQVSAVRLTDGTEVGVDGILVLSMGHPNDGIAEELGCDLTDTPLGARIVVSGQQETSVPNVFAAGDVTRAAGNLASAIADGSMAGVAAHRSLIFDQSLPKKERTSSTKRVGASVAAK